MNLGCNIDSIAANNLSALELGELILESIDKNGEDTTIVISEQPYAEPVVLDSIITDY